MLNMLSLLTLFDSPCSERVMGWEWEGVVERFILVC